MNLKAFFVTSLSQALELGVATPDAILRHISADLLAQHLPRPLWARLLTACVGAPSVDAQLVIETIGVPNLCEHAPAPLLWACIADIAQRSLGVTRDPIVTRPTSASAAGSSSSATPAAIAGTSDVSARTRSPLTAPPPDVIAREPVTPPPPVNGPSIPGLGGSASLTDVVAELEAEGREDRPTPSPFRTRTPTQQRFRQSNTGIGRLAGNASRRPQAAAAPEPPPAAPARPVRRGSTEVTDYDLETDVRDDWKSTLAVEDEQLVDWSGTNEETQTTDEFGRKR
ncbi:MAG: hypothetical protein H0X17_12390 [Deltaproteobacteria bacterium]|nr:hypothetical protein [Deltaproteobacteria bacterium]